MCLIKRGSTKISYSTLIQKIEDSLSASQGILPSKLRHIAEQSFYMSFFKGRLTLPQMVGSAVIGVASGIYIFKPYFQAVKIQSDILSTSAEASVTSNESPINDKMK